MFSHTRDYEYTGLNVARERFFIWQIGVNLSIQNRRQVDHKVFLWSRVSRTRQC